MKKMIHGIRDFRHTTFPRKKALFAKLSSGQAPEVLFITCSDSRVVPHLITGTDPGDLFVIRNAGNLVPAWTGDGTGEEATIEFAASVVGVKYVVVCGHSDCAAMRGVLDPDSVSSLPSVAKWLGNEQRTIDSVAHAMGPKGSIDDRLALAVEMNALHQIDRLRGHPAVAEALRKGTLSLHAWVYEIGTGHIRAYDQAKRAYIPLEDTLHPITRPLERPE